MPDNGAQRGPADQGTTARIDTSVAHEARVYDYWLGGKDNYPADRALGDVIATHVPAIRTMARANRAFLGRAVRYLVQEAGIDQFLDVGTGIPTAGNTHEVAQRHDPAARVVYVDNDPIVLAHARALMSSTGQGRTAFIHADLHDPGALLGDPALPATLDTERPVAIMLVAILMYFRDEDDPAAKVRALLDAVPSGSYLVITHPTADFDARAMARVVESAESAGIPFRPRSRAETENLFAGTDLVDPGVVPVVTWRPDLAERGADAPAEATSAWYWAGVARKP
ncbi:SAM-dependent methyltransferase [Nocardia puris]|uniref:S-adenosyl methyltransferase n=1 Tax=Nocardia puris TaxID=208602 RepID=A0A366DUE2_9NOCA|nr:SAM-dependent methyltransferase [Nocardia puris]MBF6210290.1 SAM-dependent methyltransferase [Nocardia puris]MBF6367366.1 SAM-dependent methyltransferase [Nocardia puris]MBF6457551.1 SAM-dependent methyltransferase [Nocardia puris]RBO93710.1 S-adenosyl methyltransferase [Nocardia puris]